MARSVRTLAALIGVLAVLLMPQAVAQETVAIEVARKATLLDGGGQVVELQVTVTCPVGAEVLEAFLYVTQDSNQSPFAFFQPVCDGFAHTFPVQIQAAAGFVFQQGRVQVSGYLLLTTGEAVSPTGVVKLRG
jgi:hypothetical protein